MQVTFVGQKEDRIVNIPGKSLGGVAIEEAALKGWNLDRSRPHTINIQGSHRLTYVVEVPSEMALAIPQLLFNPEVTVKIARGHNLHRFYSYRCSERSANYFHGWHLHHDEIEVLKAWKKDGCPMLWEPGKDKAEDIPVEYDHFSRILDMIKKQYGLDEALLDFGRKTTAYNNTDTIKVSYVIAMLEECFDFSWSLAKEIIRKKFGERNKLFWNEVLALIIEVRANMRENWETFDLNENRSISIDEWDF